MRRSKNSCSPTPSGGRVEPDWAKVHDELKTKGVTLQLLWQEYKTAYRAVQPVLRTVSRLEEGA